MAMSTTTLFLLPNHLSSPPNPCKPPQRPPTHGFPSRVSLRTRSRRRTLITACSTSSSNGSRSGRRSKTMADAVVENPSIDCVGTGTEAECFFVETSEADQLLPMNEQKERTAKLSFQIEGKEDGVELDAGFAGSVWEWALLVSPFFFLGTAMVAMKEVIPKAGPFFVSAFRLVPAGIMLVGFATARGRKQPDGVLAWVSIILFGAVDAACFQGFLSEGLQKTSAGLGSGRLSKWIATGYGSSGTAREVIIDSQPLTVAILAALLFGESIGLVGAAGLVLGVIGLLLLEVPAISHEGNSFSIWGSGEWWMLLAAQSMAVGTVMVRWVSKYSDPIMATGWHMIIGGIPLLVISVLNHDPAITGSLSELTSSDILALIYTTVFGSAISYGVYFYNATRGSLTKLSSLTFLTPMFASIFGFLYLGETFSPLQLFGALVTLVAIYMVNYRGTVDKA